MKTLYSLHHGSDQLDSRFTLIHFWFKIESTNDSQINESRFTFLYFWFDLIMIRRWIVIRYESKSKRIKMNKINLDRKKKWIKIQINCESKWIKIKNKMIRQRESKIKKKLIHLTNQSLFEIFDSLWRIKNSRIKINRFGPNPALHKIFYVLEKSFSV